ncbi:MAG: sigma-70 family RNA polymerase sigma factor [Chloroflexi bacterium]|nr:sigma-70 family RNA polymerase sigma factor [Chloroflexota bacterium]
MGDLSGLVVAARKGDSDAFEEVLRRFQDMAVGYAYATLGDWQEAEDAAQEAFIAAWVGLVNLREAAAFPGWFRRIVHTQAQRRLRVKEPLLVSLEQVAEIAADDGREQVEHAPMADDIAAALEALPEAQRTVALLHYMNDFRQREIAAFLEIPIGTVKSRLYHARRSMKERMTVLSELSTQRPSRDNQFIEKVMRLFAAAKTGDSAAVKRMLGEDSGLANASG